MRNSSMRPLSAARVGAATLAPPSPNGSASTGSSTGAPCVSGFTGRCAPSEPPKKREITTAATAISASTDQTRAPRIGATAASRSSSTRLEAGRIELLLHSAQNLRQRRIDTAHLETRHLHVGRFVGHAHVLDAAALEIGRMPVGKVLVLERAQGNAVAHRRTVTDDQQLLDAR